MASSSVTRATTATQSGAVYLLPHIRRQRFKVGWSLRPLRRARHLPEGLAGELDLARAQVAWFREVGRARQVERTLLRGLAPYGVDTGHRGDGRTEWFDVRGLGLARQMLMLLSAVESNAKCARLLGIEEPPTWQVEPSIDESGMFNVWIRVDDLWRRLADYVPLKIDLREVELRWRGLTRLNLPDTYLLRAHVADPETYSWKDEGGARSLLSVLQWDGDDLVLRLTLARQLQRWPGGVEVEQSLRMFLQHYSAEH